MEYNSYRKGAYFNNQAHSAVHTKGEGKYPNGLVSIAESLKDMLSLQKPGRPSMNIAKQKLWEPSRYGGDH